MREGNGSRQQDMGLDNGGGVEHGCGVERTGGAAGDKAQQRHMKGWRHGNGSKRGSIDTRQSRCGWAGSGVGAKGHNSREVEVEEGQRFHHHPSSALASMILAQL